MRILIVENNERVAGRLAGMIGLLDSNLDIRCVRDLSAAQTAIDSDCCEVALVDMDPLQAEHGGTSALRKLCARVAVVVVADNVSSDMALRVIRCGIQDFFPKSEATPERMLRAMRLARERHLREKRLRQIACIDQLTGFLNRRGLVAAVRNCSDSAAKLEISSALLTIDLDEFKSINDSFGHPAGDEILRQAGRRIARCVRQNDIVGRAGGDEFWVIVNGVKSAGSIQFVAAKILRSIASDFLVESKRIRTAASIGVALAPEHAETAGDWIRNSDSALYAAKRQGRNRWIMYDPRPGKVDPQATLQMAH